MGVTEAVLKDGKNTYKVVCTAEDGTEQSYTVYVVKMSKFDSIANLGVVAGKTSTTTTTKKAQTESNPKAISLSNMPVWLISVICVLIFALGFSIGFCVKKFGKKRVKNDEINYIDFVEKKK